MLKIKEIYGYDLSYDDRRRYFVIIDTDGTELAHAKDQDQAEAKAKVLSKQELKRIHILKVGTSGQITRGELTSVNKDDKSAWVSMEKTKSGWGSGRQKIDLRFDRGCYEATEANLKIVETIAAKVEVRDKILAEIESLQGTLEKPINLAYWGEVKQ